jgi:hypothetical protein
MAGEDLFLYNVLGAEGPAEESFLVFMLYKAKGPIEMEVNPGPKANIIMLGVFGRSTTALKKG